MDKNEKLLRKLDKLLARYGVEDENVRKEFLDDLSTYKDEAEENTEEETPSTTDEVKADTTENAETETPETEKTDEVKEEEKNENTENTEKVEETQEEQPKEEVKEDTETQNTETETQKVVDDFGVKFEEQAKTLEALSSRIASIEEIVAKLGVEQKPVGMEANTQAELQGENDAFDYFTRKRIG